MQLGMFEPAPVLPVIPPLSLRYYQQEAREGVHDVHSRLIRGALVELPTGTGKSRLAGALCWDEHVAGGRTLILTPTITLTRQMYKDMRALGLRVGMEQASNHCERPLPPVVIACIDSMKGKRLESFKADDFTLVITDETHRCVSPKFAAVYKHFESARLAGLTATPDRADGVSLANVYGDVAYRMTMMRAIKEDWLVPLRFKTARTNFDPRQLKTLAGEVDAGSVAAELVRSGLLHEAARTLGELHEGERTVAFLPTVHSSQAFVAELEARGIPAAHVDASTPEQHRDEVVAQFVAGTIRVISNVGIFIEGWDCPSASVVAILNPTKSRSRIAQMIGRCTRKAPGKTSALIIDFCPGRMKKGRLASPADALAGKMLPDDVFDHVGDEGELLEAIEKAETTAAEIQEREAKRKERAEKKRARRLELAKLARERDFRYQVETHDAADILDGSGNGHSDVFERAVTRPASEEQVNRLLAWGLPKDRVSAMTASEANKVISQMIGRAKAGMASYKQLKWIRSYVPVSDNTPMTVAGQAIEYIKRSRRPDPKVLSSILEGRA